MIHVIVNLIPYGTGDPEQIAHIRLSNTGKQKNGMSEYRYSICTANWKDGNITDAGICYHNRNKNIVYLLKSVLDKVTHV